MDQKTSNAKPGLMQASSLLFLMMMGNNFCNYVFHALASRNLGPSDYGGLVSMLAFLSLLAVPSQTIQIVTAKWTAVEELTQRYDRITQFVLRVMKKMVIGGILGWLFLIISSKWMADFFHLSSLLPVIAVGGTALIMLTTPILRGVLQGFQRFNALGINLLVDGLVRVGVGVLVFWAGYKVAGGVLASAMGGIAGFVLAVWALPELRRTLFQRKPVMDLKEYKQYSVSAFGCFGAYMALSTIDIILVKHFFQPEAAGYYAAGSMVGKAFLFLPYAVAHVLFPKVSAEQAHGRKTITILNKSLGLTVLVLGLGILAVWFLAPLVIQTLFGQAFMLPQTVVLVKYFGIAVTPLALLFVLMQYNLAIKDKLFFWIILFDLPVFFAGLWFFHHQLETVLWVVGCNHLLVFAVGMLLTVRRARI
ncbi:hypothetical protein K8S19_07645 [bacterium]|nr:hypothetical protein [bacterium]